MLNHIFRMRQHLTQLLSIIGASIMTVLVMCVSWQVISRYLLSQPSTLTDELSRFLLIWLVLVGAAICSSSRRHIAIDLLQSILKARSRRYVDVYIQLMVGAFSFVIMVIGGLRMVETSMGEISPALQISMSYVYASLPVSGSLICFFCIVNLIESLFSLPPDAGSEAPSIDEVHK